MHSKTLDFYYKSYPRPTRKKMNVPLLISDIHVLVCNSSMIFASYAILLYTICYYLMCHTSSVERFSENFDYTPPKSEIIRGRNVGTNVVCGIIFFFEKKATLKI